MRRGGREAEGGGLLNRYTVISRIVGSNPIPSAKTLSIYLIEFAIFGDAEIRPTYEPTRVGRLTATIKSARSAWLGAQLGTAF